jgi:Ser/Thr protein kinase RdoA (MazF antagonist)
MSQSVWGDTETQFFYDLTPGRILDAVESSTGLRCTGRALALNSMENRVYEIELDLDERPKNPSERFLIAKFYRPGRWTRDQILEEHQYLAELAELEIPVVAPRPFIDGSTLHQLPDGGLYYALFPKIGGRSPDELSESEIAQVGRLLGRMHNVGAAKPAQHRLKLTPETYGTANLQHLLAAGIVPRDVEKEYAQVIQDIVQLTSPWFQATTSHRIHGDCHRGNLLMGRTSADGNGTLFFVDFDDMVTGPAVQDLWLLIPSRDEQSVRLLNAMLEGYESMRSFDWSTLRLMEALRALRFIHFSAWIGRRWQDPAFPRAFPEFNSPRYWREQLTDLREQWELLQRHA